MPPLGKIYCSLAVFNLRVCLCCFAILPPVSAPSSGHHWGNWLFLLVGSPGGSSTAALLAHSDLLVRHSPPSPAVHMFLEGGWIKSRPGTVSHCAYNSCSVWIQNHDVQADTFFALSNAISGTVLALSSPAPSRELNL